MPDTDPSVDFHEAMLDEAAAVVMRMPCFGCGAESSCVIGPPATEAFREAHRLPEEAGIMVPLCLDCHEFVTADPDRISELASQLADRQIAAGSHFRYSGIAPMAPCGGPENTLHHSI